MKGREGAWVGWTGEAGGHPPEPFEARDMWLRPIALSEAEVEDHYEGFSNDTLWPIYHDVIVPARSSVGAGTTATAGSTTGSPRSPPRWRPAGRPSGCTTTSSSSSRPCCAPCDRTCGSAGSTTSRSRRSSCSRRSRGGASSSRGCSAPTCSASSGVADAQNFLRVVRRLLDLPVKGDHVTRARARHGAPAARPGRGLPDLGRRRRAWKRWPGPRRSRTGPSRSAPTWATPSTSCWASTGSTTPRGSGTGSRPFRSYCPTAR